jgi:chromosome segregation ATPase
MLAPFFKKKDSDGLGRAEPKLQQAEAQRADGPRAEAPIADTARTDAARAEGVRADSVPEAVYEQEERGEYPSRNAAPAKARMDKLSLDLLGVAEQMIQAKQLAEQKILELQDRLHQAGGHIDRLTRDIRNLDQMIGERDHSIADLEQKLAGKNLKVDQVLEDYRELQTAMSAEIEGMKGLLDMEQTKYRTLLQKHNDAQAEKTKKVNELEERISKLEIENGHMKAKYEAQLQEKAYLDRMINDFTSRMAAPFEPGSKNRPQGSGE